MSKRTKEFLLFLAISLTVRWLYVLTFHGCQSFDLLSWNKVGDILMAGGNPYHLTSNLNWPPFWMQLVFLFKKISLATHWPFDIVVRGFLVVGESALAWLLYVTVKEYTKCKDATELLVFGVAVNPVCILQVCQHCNFDVLIGFWVLLTIYMLLRFQDRHESRFWLCACFALGMGTLTKTVPLSLMPLLLLSIRKVKPVEQMIGLILFLGPVILALSILYVLGPEDIKTNVFGYRSISGYFGLPGLLACWGASRWLAIYPYGFEVIYGIGWICLAAWLWSKETLNQLQIISVAVIILLAIPTLGPGYGPQYVYWFLPLLVLMYPLVEGKFRLLLMILYGIGMVTYLTEYSLFPGHGAILFSIVSSPALFNLATRLASPAGETFLRLPLWMLYFILLAWLGTTIGKEMARDFRNAWSRR